MDEAQTHKAGKHRLMKSLRMLPPSAPSTIFLPACRNKGALGQRRDRGDLSKHHQLHQPSSKSPFGHPSADMG